MKPEDFQAIARLASAFSNATTVVISLGNNQSQIIRSQIGLNAPQTEEALAFCHRVILQKTVLVKNQSLQDKFIFSAGIAFSSEDEKAMGSLCVFDNRERNLSEVQVQGLNDLAEQLTRLLEIKNLKTRSRAIEAISDVLFF
jgi:hypothetical protein